MQYGKVVAVRIPGPASPAEAGTWSGPAAGKAIVEFADVNQAVKAHHTMDGRWYGGQVVTATFVPEQEYISRQHEAHCQATEVLL